MPTYRKSLDQISIYSILYTCTCMISLFFCDFISMILYSSIFYNNCGNCTRDKIFEIFRLASLHSTVLKLQSCDTHYRNTANVNSQESLRPLLLSIYVGLLQREPHLQLRWQLKMSQRDLMQRLDDISSKYCVSLHYWDDEKHYY